MAGTTVAPRRGSAEERAERDRRALLRRIPALEVRRAAQERRERAGRVLGPALVVVLALCVPVEGTGRRGAPFRSSLWSLLFQPATVLAAAAAARVLVSCSSLSR